MNEKDLTNEEILISAEQEDVTFREIEKGEISENTVTEGTDTKSEEPEIESETETEPETESESESEERTAEVENTDDGAEGICESAEIAEEISSEAFAHILRNPMFAIFARGRSGDIEQAVRDFARMMEAGKYGLSEEDRMKMTPGAGYGAVSEIALSERQRRIARAAGISYREYYETIQALPSKQIKK